MLTVSNYHYKNHNNSYYLRVEIVALIKFIRQVQNEYNAICEDMPYAPKGLQRHYDAFIDGMLRIVHRPFYSASNVKHLLLDDFFQLYDPDDRTDPSNTSCIIFEGTKRQSICNSVSDLLCAVDMAMHFDQAERKSILQGLRDMINAETGMLAIMHNMFENNDNVGMFKYTRKALKQATRVAFMLAFCYGTSNAYVETFSGTLAQAQVHIADADAVYQVHLPPTPESFWLFGQENRDDDPYCHDYSLGSCSGDPESCEPCDPDPTVPEDDLVYDECKDCPNRGSCPEYCDEGAEYDEYDEYDEYNSETDAYDDDYDCDDN